ncbi:hypothetical protein ACIRG4_00685 [Streptomyces sp. NPDC102395]|uniref:hypothetical protein n=1 Tax=Streptomyces sp. NPDC102395 TaxID=3366168 RepID=UPI00380FDD2B
MDDDRSDVLLTGLLFNDLVLTGLAKPPTPGEEVWTAAHRGLGTASCGPDAFPSRLVAPGVRRWNWTLRAL